MANPPFNISEWWDAKLEGDPRWRYGTPPRGNANLAWIQHMLHHLAPEAARKKDDQFMSPMARSLETVGGKTPR